MSIQLCSRADCPFAEFTDDLCDVEGVSCVAYWKARDALTKYFKFADFCPGELAALMPLSCSSGNGNKCRWCVDYSPLNGLMDQQVCFAHVGNQLVSSQPQLFAS